MNWETSKSTPKIPGMVAVEVVDGNVKSLTFDTPTGQVRIAYRDYSGLVFQLPEKPKTETRWKVSGTVDGLDIVPKYFDARYKAQGAADKGDDLIVTEVQCIIEDGITTDKESV